MIENRKLGIIAESSMSKQQMLIIGLCVCLNALDGFEVLAISFAAPGIAEDWGINRAALGVVLSMELVGMAFGSVSLGTLADQVGRKPVVIGCMLTMVIGMGAAAVAANVTELSVARLFTGFGVGGMLAVTNAIVCEFSNLKYRNMVVTWMATGYPLGVIVGGSLVSYLLNFYDWRSVFVVGAILSAILIPAVLFILPESVSYLYFRQPDNALIKINQVLKKINKNPLDSLPKKTSINHKTSLVALFSPGVARITCLLSIAYFAHIITFYFVLKWVPKIVVDLGYSPAEAGGVLVWANVGGITGALVLSLLTHKFKVTTLVLVALIGASAAVTYFGFTVVNIKSLILCAVLVGFFTNAAVVGMYAIFANRFPTQYRAGGTGFVIGFGRGGAALGPIVAGYLFSAGHSLAVVALAMALGSVVALIALISLPRDPAEQTL